jgi:hypothetical protein
MQHRFPWIIALCTAIILAALALTSFFAAPEGYRWLGDGVHNSSDIAVYLSYLQQGADGHVLLTDLFAVEPHARRFDPVWSLLGLIARSGVHLIALHEIARIGFAVMLIFALWLAARDMEREEKNARLVLLLLVGGVATGWIYSIWLGMRGLWTPMTYAAPDIVTEFAIGPILFGGAHAIFSLALLVTSIRLLWNGITKAHRRHALLGMLAGITLLSFHPYFSALLGTIGILAGIRSTDKRRSFFFLASIGIAFCLPLLYYVWLLLDPVFGAHHLSANILPLAPLPVWLLTLFPFIVASVWMWRTKRLPRTFTWTHAWLLALIILLVFLPVPWKRKLTEGAIVPLVLLTMPAWIAIRDWILSQPSKLLRTIIAGLVLLAAFLGPLHLVTSHVAWIHSSSKRDIFFRPNALFEAAAFIQQSTTDDAILLSDVPWTNVWLPALTGHRVWIGHDHETPDFQTKRALYQELLETTDVDRIREILRDTHITHLLLTDETETARIVPAIEDKWTRVFSTGSVSIWMPIY